MHFIVKLLCWCLPVWIVFSQWIFDTIFANFVNSNKMLFSKENVIFEIFISTTFVFKRDEVHGMEKVCGWVFRFLLSGMKLLILASVLAFILCCDTRHQMVSHWRFLFFEKPLISLSSILLWNYGIGVCLSESFFHKGYLIPFSHLLQCFFFD